MGGQSLGSRLLSVSDRVSETSAKKKDNSDEKEAKNL